MAETTTRVELIDIDRIIPNPFGMRESIEEEPLKEMAKTIKTVGLLQPISVRPKGRRYEIIQGERRWRASKLAGLKRIPAIVKEVDDRRMMLESLIENVHREDLKPIEKAKGLAEVYRLAGFEPAKIQFQLKAIDDALTRPERRRELTEEENRIKEVADMVGLSYDYQYRLLTQLRLTPEEQKRVTELGLGYEKIASIATIEKPEVRSKVIEVAPELKMEEVKKLSKVVKEAPEHVIEAVLKPKTRITPRVAEKLLELPKEKQVRVIQQIEGLRLEEEEAMFHLETMKLEAPSPQPEQIEAIREQIRESEERLKAILERPEVKERGKLFENWVAHGALLKVLGSAHCPVCGAGWENLEWRCHNLNIKKAYDLLTEQYQKAIKSEENKGEGGG
jgi:hypothetical protein